MLNQKKKILFIPFLISIALMTPNFANATLLETSLPNLEEETQLIPNEPTFIEKELAESIDQPIELTTSPPQISENALMKQEMIDMQPEDEILGQNVQEMNHQLAIRENEEGDYQATYAREERPGFLNFLNIPNLLILLFILGSAVFMIRRYAKKRERVACVSLIRNNNIHKR